MNPKQEETEVKFHHADLEAIRRQLEDLSAEIIQTRVFERNVRYEHVDGLLAEQGAVLRLREDNQVRLTYKTGARIERGISTREELEVSVSDFGTMEKLLNRLGYEAYMVYEKYRTTYKLGNVEIMLDEMPYGSFVEIEGSIEEIEEILMQLGLEDVERSAYSYTRIFDFVKHHLELRFHDLTFENFKDIAVPKSAFIPPGSVIVG